MKNVPTDPVEGSRFMKTVGQHLRYIAVVAALLSFSHSCSSSNFTTTSRLSPAGRKTNNPNTSVVDKTPSPQATQNQNGGSSSPVIPPVEVTGSFLTGIFFNDYGTPVSNADLKIVANSYETKTNPQGEFKIPVSKIPADTFDVQVSNVANGPDQDSSSYTVQTTLPSDLAAVVQSEKSNTTVTRDIEQKLGWTFPRNMSPTGEDGSFRYVLSTVTLPKAEGGVSVGILPSNSQDSNGLKYLNESNGGGIRLSWSAPAGSNTFIVIGKDKSVIESVQKDPQGAFPAGTTPILAYEACTTDGSYSSSAAGPLGSSGKCGIKFLPTGAGGILDQESQYFFRVLIVNGSNNYISAVDRLKYSAPTWAVYHTAIESCYPKYFGPSLFLDGTTTIDPAKFGSGNKPACDETTRGRPHCTSQDDGSPSKCLSCESSLLLCN
jgi:hypothetical protein